MSDQDNDEKKQYEARLQRRLQILGKQFEAGKIKIAEGSIFVESLKKVRSASDGTVDLNTVDSAVRSMALAVEVMHDREELKNTISLAEIQTIYFNFLDNNFGPFYKIMLERGLTPHDAGMALSRKQSSIETLIKRLPGFLETVEEFWSQTADVAHAHVEDMQDSLKGIFGGDLFPSHNENIASKCGIYTDTIVLPDPFLKSKHLFEVGTPEQQSYYLIKHGLNLLQYKELACADITPPVVVVLPDQTAIDEDEKKFFFRVGQADALIHAARVFGRQFESFEELMEFASSLDTIESVESEVADQKRVLFNTAWEGDFKTKLQRATTEDFVGLLRTNSPGIIVVSEALGRMSTSNELLIKARRLHGTPIIDAPTSWQYFVWKLEYDAQNAEKEDNLRNLHVLRGLQSVAENEMVWLGKVPPNALIEIRKVGALDEIRTMLSKGISDLAHANPTNFYRTSDQVFDNIHAAFADHKKNIEALSSKKYKFAGTDIGSWFVVGSLAVTAAATGLPVWGLAAIAADQLLAAPKLKDIPKYIRELAEESKQLRESPVGMLFKYRDLKS